MTSRGIVITSPFEFDGNMLSTKGTVDPISLRQYLIYWDKIEWPDNNLISIGGETPELLFLIDVGLIERTKIKITSFSGNIVYSMLIMQEAVLALRNKQEPGCWSLAQPRKVLILPDEVSEQFRTIEVELYKSIPVPIAAVALEDILKFKEQRKDELIRFRGAMDRLYLEIINSCDVPRAKTRAINEIEHNLSDLNRVFNETWKEKLLSTVKVELNIPNLATHALAGAGTAAAFGFSPAVGAAIGAMTASLKLDFSSTVRAKNLPRELLDFAYLHYIEKDLK